MECFAAGSIIAYFKLLHINEWPFPDWIWIGPLSLGSFHDLFPEVICWRQWVQVFNGPPVTHVTLSKHWTELRAMILTTEITHCPFRFWLVAWHSGRISVFGRRTFPVLRSTCCRRVTTYVGKPSVMGQPTRPTQPFIPSGSIDE